MHVIQPVFLLAAGVAAAPLLAMIITKVKAWFSGRKGPAWLQNYSTLRKLLRKTPVYSTSTTFIFRLGPVIILAGIIIALCLMPMAGRAPLVSFSGDVILLLYLLGLGRFFIISAAMDTASPFEGMGAAREALYGALAETTVFVILILFERLEGGLSLSSYLSSQATLGLWGHTGASTILVIIALFMVLLTENARVPVDDPTTHLELTMIHEVMVLDHSGPEFALIEAASWLKLFFYSAFIANLLCPFRNSFLGLIFFPLLVIIIYAIIGVVESITARYKLNMVPKFILTSFALAFFALFFSMEYPL